MKILRLFMVAVMALSFCMVQAQKKSQQPDKPKAEKPQPSPGDLLFAIIVFSWGIAFFEYCCQVPANRMGFEGNGGPFNLVQLKVIQECISLAVFAVIANILFQHQNIHWNHILAFFLIICAVYLVFMK